MGVISKSFVTKDIKQMRLSSKIIEEVVEEVAGDDVVPLVNILKNKKNVSEFKLAENLDIEVNRVRNMLYRLHDANLVSFIRKKDKKKGWYIYYWTFNNDRVKYLSKEIKKQRIEKLMTRLERESQGQFYTCTENKCIRLDFDQAMNFEFKCPECGNLIDQEDNTDYVNRIKEEIENLKEELREIEIKAAKKKISSSKKVKKKSKKRIVKKKVSKKKKVKKKSKKRIVKKKVKKKR